MKDNNPSKVFFQCLIVFKANFHFVKVYDDSRSVNFTKKIKFFKWLIKSSIDKGIIKPNLPSFPLEPHKSSFDNFFSCPLMKIDEDLVLNYRRD